MKLTQLVSSEVVQFCHESPICSQSKLDDFHSGAWSLLENDSFWIDVTAFSVSNFHCTDESAFSGLFTVYIDTECMPKFSH